MKISSKFLRVFTLLFCLTALFSCQEEKVEPPFNFEHFQQEIATTTPYLNYMEAQQIFFRQLENHEIDLFGIMAELKQHEFESLCSIDAQILNKFKGGPIFIEGICSMHKYKIELYANNRELSNLTEDQLWTLFRYTPLHLDLNSVGERVENCLDNFNQDLINNEALCIPDTYPLTAPYSERGANFMNMERCLHRALIQAADGYDRCCDQGGTGCP